MTMQFDLGDLTARIMAQLTPDEQDDVLDEVGKLSADYFEEFYSHLIEQAGLETATPGWRLMDYMTRPDEVWTELRMLDPKAFKEDMDDYHDLAEKVMG